mgnify:CR=1 FL=1
MLAVFDLVRQIAPTRSPVLITGETGTGKELVARAIHALSPRRDKLVVALNCTAIPADLLESELFGHVRGAFSGAHADRIGRFQAADEGTLFLDEIGDMDVRLQAKLLRVLEEGVIEPLGTNRRVPVDVRIVSSTHRDLTAAMASGAFREDLYFRLNVLRVHLPAAPRTRRRRAGARRGVPRRVRARAREDTAAARPRRGRLAAALRVARQRTRAQKRHGARGRARADRTSSARRSCAR